MRSFIQSSFFSSARSITTCSSHPYASHYASKRASKPGFFTSFRQQLVQADTSPLYARQLENFSQGETSTFKANLSGWKQYSKAELADMSPLITVSVGQPNHEGNRFVAQLATVENNFKECTVLVGDLLQRHTLAMTEPGLSDSECETMAPQQGKEWVKRNVPFISELSIPYRILHWDHWLFHSNFLFVLERVESLYQERPEFREMFDQNAVQCIDRLERQGGLCVSQEEALARSLTSLKEESAAVILWREEFDAEIYPAGRGPAMETTLQTLQIRQNGFPCFGIDFKAIKTQSEPEASAKVSPEAAAPKPLNFKPVDAPSSLLLLPSLDGRGTSDDPCSSLALS